MTTPLLRAGSQAQNNAANATITLNCLAGDLIILANKQALSGAPTPPTGVGAFTEIAQSAGYYSTQAWYAFATANQVNSTITVPSTADLIVSAFSGVNTTTPIDTVCTTQMSYQSGNNPTVTPDYIGDLLVGIEGVNGSSVSETTNFGNFFANTNNQFGIETIAAAAGVNTWAVGDPSGGGGFSTLFFGITQPNSLRAAPTISALGLNGNVLLSGWSLNANETVTINRSTVTGEETQLADGITASLYYDSTAANGTEYFYTAQIVNTAGTSAASSEVNATPSGAIKTLQVVGGNQKAYLSWLPLPIKGETYNIYQGTAAGAENANPVMTGITANNAVVTGLTNATEYFFTVKPVVNAIVGAASSEGNCTPNGLPSAVTCVFLNSKATAITNDAGGFQNNGAGSLDQNGNQYYSNTNYYGYAPYGLMWSPANNCWAMNPSNADGSGTADGYGGGSLADGPASATPYTTTPGGSTSAGFYVTATQINLPYYVFQSATKLPAANGVYYDAGVDSSNNQIATNGACFLYNANISDQWGDQFQAWCIDPVLGNTSPMYNNGADGAPFNLSTPNYGPMDYGWESTDGTDTTGYLSYFALPGLPSVAAAPTVLGTTTNARVHLTLAAMPTGGVSMGLDLAPDNAGAPGTWQNNYLQNITGGAKIAISGLTANTKYWVRQSATNLVGTTTGTPLAFTMAASGVAIAPTYNAGSIVSNDQGGDANSTVILTVNANAGDLIVVTAYNRTYGFTPTLSGVTFTELFPFVNNQDIWYGIAPANIVNGTLTCTPVAGSDDLKITYVTWSHTDQFTPIGAIGTPIAISASASSSITPTDDLSALMFALGNQGMNGSTAWSLTGNGWSAVNTYIGVGGQDVTIAGYTGDLTAGTQFSTLFNINTGYFQGGGQVLFEILSGIKPLPVAPAAPTTSTINANKIAVNIPALDSGTTSFDLYRALDVSGSPGAYTLMQAAVTPSAAYDDLTPIQGGVYWYRLTGNNDAGSTNGTGVKAYSYPNAPLPNTGPTYGAPNATSLLVNIPALVTGTLSYNLQRAADVAGVAGSYSTITTAPTPNAAYTDNSVSPLTKYWYRIIAINPGGTMTGTGSSIITTATPIGIPSGLTATAGNGFVSLTCDTASSLISYVWYRSLTGANKFEVVGETATNAFTDRNVVNGVGYDYAIAGADTTHITAYSAPVTNTIPAGVNTGSGPTAPTALAGNIDINGNANLTWTA